VVLLHVAVAFWFVAGLIGRNLTLTRARSRQQVRLVAELVELAGRFERLMVIPVTEPLARALRDPVVAAARTLELVVVAALVTLMVVKPF
jgi:hypothetical protein